MMFCSSSSLLVEPKQPADTVPMSDMRQLFNWATRSQSTTTTAAAAAATMIQWKWLFGCLSLSAPSDDDIPRTVRFFFSVWDGFFCGYLFFLFFQGKLVFFLSVYFILYFEKTKTWTISSRYRHLFDFWLCFSSFIFVMYYLIFMSSLYLFSSPSPLFLAGLVLCCLYLHLFFFRSSCFLFDLDLFFFALCHFTEGLILSSIARKLVSFAA